MANLEYSKGVRSEKFSDKYLKRWANQIKYWLTTLGVISAIDDTILHLLLHHYLLDLLLLKLLLQLLPPTYIWNLRKLTIIVSTGFLVHSLIVYMTFIMNIRVLKNHGQLSRKNMASMILESKDSPPPPSVNSWWPIVNLSMINFMNFKTISDTFNRKEINSPMITRCLVLLTNSLLPGQPLLEISVTSKVTWPLFKP